MFNFFQGVPAPPFVHPAAFSGIYSEDAFVNHTAQPAPHGFPFAHARVHPFGRQRGHHHYHHHPRHYHRHRHPGGPYGGSFSPASLGNLWNGFGPAYSGSHPPSFSPNHRGAAFSPEELAYSFLQQDVRQRAHDRRLEAIARQRELAREREAQRQRAIAEAVAREQQARAAREAHARAANAARAHARQSRDEEVLLALLAQLGLAVASVQSVVDASQANTEPPSVQLTPPAAPAAPASAPSEPPMPTDRKGKGKAVDVPVEVTASTSTPAHAPAPAKTPSLKEELEARIRTETDPDVQESLILLYSDIYDARAPAQPVAGPSGHKLEHVSFQVPISGPPPSASTAPVQAEEAIDAYTTVPSYTATLTVDAAEDHDGANPADPDPLPSLAQIKDVEDTLRKLEGAFEFPAQLDFADRPPSPSPSPSPSTTHSESEAGAESESAELAYTANNTPVHAYEHALNELLTRLDAVESNGDVEVRGRRREVVKEVERALEAMERRIEESRERSRERARAKARRGSQVSDASVTIAPYNVHSSDDVDEVEVAVVVEEVPVEVEEPEATSVVAEDTALQVEVVEYVPAPTNENFEATVAPPLVDNLEPEPEHSPLAIGIPDSGADITAPSLSHASIFSDPSSPVDEDEEGPDGAFDAFSPSSDASASQVVPPAVEILAEPSPDLDDRVTEQGNVGAASQDAQSEAVSEPHSPPEPAEESKIVPSSTQPAVVAPEAISRVESTATDATFVTADAAPLSATDDATIFTAPGPSEPEPTQPLAPALTVPTPGSPASTSSAGEEAFLLSSTPLADEQRPASTVAGDSDDADELEIIGKEELEAARDDSDWSDVESESDLEIVL